MRLGSCLLYLYFLLCCSALPRAKDYQKLGGAIGSEFVPAAATSKARDREPSCEELRAMWRFSKRQSRATEITNEIPTYRDPFAYNVWEPYARSRSVGGGVVRGGGRGSGRHVYGRIVHDVPRARPRENSPERIRAFEEVARLYGTIPQGTVLPRRKVTSFRLPGGGVPIGHLPQFTPQSGSFQQLKELIRTERARELQEQRMAEEAAARAAALNGVGVNSYFGHLMPADSSQHSGPTYETSRYPDSGNYEKPGGMSVNKGGVLVFPNLNAPAAAKYVDEDFLAPAHLYKHRSFSEVMPRSVDMDTGLFHH